MPSLRNRASQFASESLDQEDQSLKAITLVQAASAEGRRLLFHSGTATEFASIEEGGIEARIGAWVRQVAAGASDEFDVTEHSVPVSFFSETPNWVIAKVAQAQGRAVADITREDLLAHGHLAIVDAEDGDFYRVPKDGFDGVWVEALDGQRIEIWRTSLHRYDDMLCLNCVPFGMEPGDIVSADEYIRVAANLCGAELVAFLEALYPDSLPQIGEHTARRRRTL